MALLTLRIRHALFAATLLIAAAAFWYAASTLVFWLHTPPFMPPD